MENKNLNLYFGFQSTLAMEEKDYLSDISEIKNMMSRSSQFISLSGMSGVLAGIYALVGAFVADYILDGFVTSTRLTYSAGSYSSSIIYSDIVQTLIIIAITVVILSVITGLMLSRAKAERHGETLWNNSAKRLVTNFAIPFVTGGVFALLLLKNEIYGLIAPATMIFYGLACVNASKYTLRDVRYLGITLVIVGLVAIEFRGYALQFWAFGFGICHIFYGLIMHFKYDR